MTAPRKDAAVGDRRQASRPGRAATRRLLATVCLAAIVVAGLLVHGVLPDTAASDIAGDALYAAAVYLLVVALAPRLPALLVAAIAAVWCVAIELFQLTSAPLTAGAYFPPLVLVLGTVFDARDLGVYVLTVAVVLGADLAVPSLRRRR